MTAFHVVLGVALLTVNLAAGALGAWRWWRAEPSRAFWPLLRTGQALVVLQAADGALLLALGERLPRLHLMYGLLPLAVTFVAEQLRILAAETVLQHRGLQSSRDVAALPEPEQRAIVRDIVRREIGVMAASALVVVVLGLRATGRV